MSLSTIIILPIITAFGLLFWGNQIKEEHPLLNFMFQLMFLPMIFISIHFAVLQAQLIYEGNEFIVTQLGDLTYYLGWLMFGVGVYYCFVVLYKIYEFIQQKKEDKKRDMYGDD